MKLTYVVKIGWRCEFRFENMLDAGAFAVEAATHRTEDSDNDPIRVEIVAIDKDDIDKSEEVDDD